MKKHSTLAVRTGVCALLIGTVSLFVAWSDGRLPVASASAPGAGSDRSGTEGAALTQDHNHYFIGSGKCAGCHGHDPSGFAMTTPDGTDVNVVDDWRSSMMANSARDPFWQAKVSHEVQVDPDHQMALEDKCTSCHAPAARHDKHLTGQGPYTFDELLTDSIALDGVSCVPCHIQSRDSIGLLFSGNLKFDTLGRPLYGPFDNVFGAPMANFVGYEPQYGAHVLDAGLCAGCHTLLTATADLDGHLTGNDFVEQATYHEWVNSDFNDRVNAESGITCQGCHVPVIDDGVVLSANYVFLQPKSPFGMHHFAGANSFMLNMLKNNIDELGLTASATQFDSTIARTDRMLQHNALLLEAHVTSRDEDTAFVDVKLTNLAGHKFPSGYPARRAWVELVVTNDNGDTIYRNGGWDGHYEVIGHDASWEPHYDVVRTPDEVQIYEMVMGDVNGTKTTVLERANSKLKDNRLVPSGFRADHYAYDTAYIANVPPSDTDFNHNALGQEGSGTDIVHYHAAMHGYAGTVHVQAHVWYQSAPPKWMEEMFAHNSTQIDRFRDLYNAADNTPVLVASASLTDVSTGVDDLAELGVTIFPNPVQNGPLIIAGLDRRVSAIAVYDMAGHRVATVVSPTGGRWSVDLPAAGTYVVVVDAAGKRFSRKVVKLQ